MCSRSWNRGATMEVHNLMEDEVVRLINGICDEEEKDLSLGYCTSPECRMDAVCYVLNRTRPRYVSSARGMSHLVSEHDRDTQAHVDLVALAHEALRRISSIRREYYDSGSPDDGEQISSGPATPIITGRLLSCTTFEPVNDVIVTLMCGGKPAPMVDRRWGNPYRITGNAAGQYSFWPVAPAGSDPDIEIEYSVSVSDDRYEPFRHYFSVMPLGSPGHDREHVVRHHEHQLPDLYLVPVGPDENDERN